jgi:cytoskeletal protein RodZ
MESEEQNNFTAIIIEAIRAKNMNIEKLAQATGISDRFIQCILEERYDSLPAAPYVHGYILRLADVLNLNGEKLWQDYMKTNETIHRSGKMDTLPLNRFKAPKLGKKLIFALIGAVILLFLLLKLPTVFGKPMLVVMNPGEDNAITTNPELKITGKINPNDKLTVNGETVYSDEKGVFEKTTTLEPKFNTLVFRVKKFLGKENVLTRQIFYQVATTTKPTENATQ